MLCGVVFIIINRKYERKLVRKTKKIIKIKKKNISVASLSKDFKHPDRL